jgi:hypothetical protein
MVVFLVILACFWSIKSLRKVGGIVSKSQKTGKESSSGVGGCFYAEGRPVLFNEGLMPAGPPRGDPPQGEPQLWSRVHVSAHSCGLGFMFQLTVVV